MPAAIDSTTAKRKPKRKKKQTVGQAITRTARPVYKPSAPKDTKSAGEFRKAARERQTPRHKAARKGAREAGRKRAIQIAIQQAASAKPVQKVKRSPLETAARNSPAGLAVRAVAKGVDQYTPSPSRGRRGSRVATRTITPLASANLVSKTAKNVAIVTKEDPVGQAKKNAQALRDAALSFPGVVASTVTDPKGQIKETVGDYKRRYGPLVSGNEKQFRDRLRKEGTLGEVLDLTTLVVGPGAGASRLAGAAARQGKLGARAQRTVTAPRPKLRVDTGEARTQEVSPKLVKAATQRAVDKRRAKVQKKRAAREEAPIEVREAVRQGEVTPIRLKHAQRQQARRVAKDKGRVLQRQREEQGREVARGAGRNLAGLSKAEREAFKYALQLGATTPAAARRALAKRQADIRAERARRPDLKVSARRDELPVLARLAENADEAFTPRLAAVVREERRRAARVAQSDPGLDATQAQLRRYAQQAEHLGVKRDYSETPAEFRARRRAQKRVIARAQRRRQTALRREAKERGRTEVLVRQADVKTLRRDKDYVEASKAYNAASREYRQARKAHGNAQRNPDMWTQAERHAIENRAAKAERDLKVAKERFNAQKAKTLANAEKQVSRRARGEKGTQGAELGRAPVAAISRLERKRADVAETEQSLRREKSNLENLTPRKGETSAQFLRRVITAAQKEGLDRPGYFPSVPRPEKRFGVYTTGGSKAVAKDKKYTGELFRTGREAGDPEQYRQALARNIKRKYNFNLVADTFERTTAKWSRDKSISDLKKEVDDRNIDPNSVAFWNPGLYHAARSNYGDADLERTGGDEPVAQGVGEAVREATATYESLRTKPGDFESTKGWAIIPRAVYDEIHADTKPSNKYGRGYDVLKGKASRILLGTNPAWLALGITGNIILSGLAKTGPVDFLKAQAWYRRLPEEQKKEVDAYLGSGRFDMDTRQVKIGAAANGRLINAYRAFKDTPLWHRPRKALRGGSVSSLNPLDFLFRLDQRQNTAFRRAVLYSQAKRDTYRRMGEAVDGATDIQNRLSHLFTLGPEKQIQEALKNRELLEKHAKYVEDFLGDYTTYTATERRVFQRAVMFYGFLRFSLRFTFWTMPVKHPLMTAIIAQLSRIEADEVKKLLGGSSLPFNLGKLYYTDDGKVESVDFSGANPFGNAFSEARDLRVFLQVLPPFVGIAVDQAFRTSLFRGRPFVTGGRTPNQAKKLNYEDYDEADLIRIAADQLFSLAAPYRAAEKATQEGPQGDDSLLFSPRPTLYPTNTKTGQSIEKANRDLRETSFLGRFGRELVPFIPKPDRTVEVSAARKRSTRLREIEEEKRRLKGKTGKGHVDSKGVYKPAYVKLLDEAKRLQGKPPARVGRRPSPTVREQVQAEIEAFRKKASPQGAEEEIRREIEAFRSGR